MMAVANTVEGAIGVKSAPFSVKEVPQITLRSKNIMGVVVPEIRVIESRKRHSPTGAMACSARPR